MLGEACKEPCTAPQPRSRIYEIRLAAGVILMVGTIQKVGIVFPIGKEESILDHDLMSGYFERFGDRKFLSFRTRAEVQGKTLQLLEKQDYTFRSGGRLIHNVIEFVHEIEISDENCSATAQMSFQQTTFGRPHEKGQLRYRYPCQLESLSSQVADEAKPRALTFTNLESTVSGKSYMRMSTRFSLIGDRLFEQKSVCQDGSTLGVAFAWSGGPAEGQADCPFNDMHHTVRYRTSTTVSDSRHALSGTYVHTWIPKDAQKSGFKYDIDIAFSLDGGECRIERFKYDFYDYRLKSQPRNASTLHADSKSSCFFE